MNRLPVNPLMTRALQLAEKALGRAALAERLGVASGTIDDWRAGVEAMPHEVFLQLVDVVSAVEPDWRGNRAAPSVAGTAKRIIVVDDNVDAAFTLRQLLELLGHEATAVTDARAALDVAKALQPELAILDINMPHVNGLELARLFRAEAVLKRCHLVALTAMDGMDYRHMIREAGFDAHLRKPADTALLRAIIEQFERAPR